MQCTSLFAGVWRCVKKTQKTYDGGGMCHNSGWVLLIYHSSTDLLLLEETEAIMSGLQGWIPEETGYCSKNKDVEGKRGGGGERGKGVINLVHCLKLFTVKARNKGLFLTNCVFLNNSVVLCILHFLFNFFFFNLPLGLKVFLSLKLF